MQYKHPIGRLLALSGLTALILTTATVPAIAQKDGKKEKKHKKQVVERFEATAMNLQAGAASMIEIGILEWSSDEDRQALAKAFQEGGNKGAYEFLGKQDEKAYVRLPNSMAYQMRYAFQFNSGGKRQIILGTDRPLGMGEVMRGTQSQDDNLSLVVLNLDATTNEGTGEMMMGAEFKIDQKTGKLEIETLLNTPTEFKKVVPRKVKQKKN